MTRSRTAIILALVLAFPLPAQQANSTAARMTVNGTGAVGTPGPFTIDIQPPAGVAVALSGAPLSPFILANANAALGGTTLAPGIPLVYGILDIGPPAFPPIEILLDGFTFAGTFLGGLATVAPTGTSTLTFTVPTSVPCGVRLANLQALVAAPSAPGGGALTAAFGIQRPLPAPDAAPVPVSQGDDVTTQVPFALCNSFTFYGVAYGSYYVNSNGSVSFGGGETSLGESQTTFNSNRARVAAAWDDINPGTSGGGTLTKMDDGLTVTVQWTNVPEFVANGSNTMSITLNLTTQEVTVTYGAMSLLDALTGITPGNNLASPATVFGPGLAVGRLSDRLAGGTLGPYPGGPMESMNEVFTTSSPFNLANRTITFQPVGPPYTAYTMF